ncbi:lipopolysaccharide cholinephosphotransferase licD [Elysia marginata]|uniref:Lipopolysaccharide cholinephosphotransferase licD n=1 Tax=Elysia marginata TaxID=1093978 RepID=A0AAV4EET0_9GAST|nr:lipopolysaccharide cholinephosphotransferase licD [Elysia marginata]
MSRSVITYRITNDARKIKGLSKNGFSQTSRLRTILNMKGTSNCTYCVDKRNGLKDQFLDLNMSILDKNVKNQSLMTRGGKIFNSFRPKLQNRHTILLSIIMESFDKIMAENGMTYFLYGGALIGSFRHHGLIPWDDDADVMVSFSHRANLMRLMSFVNTDLAINFDPIHYWKLYHKDGETIPGVNWKWPFLDIFFYNQNLTHIWDMSPQYYYFIFPKSAIFPLRRRPFMSLYLFAPNDSKTVLSRGYNISMCDSGTYVHRWERKIRETRVPCSRLYGAFPFVKRVFMNGGCNETLWYQGNVLRVFFDWGVLC